ncbi:MAG: ribosome biosynthesis protein rrb1 [Phylliscum demangeonii]|nr:MAG: ribosome biosynthesis protein rrb1 [Phylliscum demangeonii]
MGKRVGEPIEAEHDRGKGGRRAPDTGIDEEPGEFEDEFGDEYESEDNGDEAAAEELGEGEHRDAMQLDTHTFIPGRHKLEPGQTLAPDPSTYEMLHTLTTTWPCLSFDLVRDQLGGNRKCYPATIYAVAGTQAEAGREKDNELLVMKMSRLNRNQRADDGNSDDDEDDDQDEDEDGDPILETRSLPLTSTVNRVRAHQLPPSNSLTAPTTMVASMLESGQVVIHDISTQLAALDRPTTVHSAQQDQPLATLLMHQATEGYAVDWSPLVPMGKLLTGDNDGKIFVTTQAEGGRWSTDGRHFQGHAGSVEEIQWSPTERNVFASAGSDGAVKIWDVRSKSRRPAIGVSVSAVDVNVMSWSHLTAHLLATGADDGAWAVWDLRQWKPPATDPGHSSSVAKFTFHREPITSIEWHPQDDSIVAVAAADHTLSLWDLAVELDDEESGDTAGVADVPAQVLFLHYMDTIKECHWHPQIPGCVMATGGAGFGIFKTISV